MKTWRKELQVAGNFASTEIFLFNFCGSLSLDGECNSSECGWWEVWVFAQHLSVPGTNVGTWRMLGVLFFYISFQFSLVNILPNPTSKLIPKTSISKALDLKVETCIWKHWDDQQRGRTPSLIGYPSAMDREKNRHRTWKAVTGTHPCSQTQQGRGGPMRKPAAAWDRHCWASSMSFWMQESSGDNGKKVSLRLLWSLICGFMLLSY